MSIQTKDFYRHYTKLGDRFSTFEIIEEDPTDGAEYYAYQNEEGSYIFQQITTSGTLRIYRYYASNKKNSVSADWTDRANKTYGYIHELFPASL